MNLGWQHEKRKRKTEHSNIKRPRKDGKGERFKPRKLKTKNKPTCKLPSFPSDRAILNPRLSDGAHTTHFSMEDRSPACCPLRKGTYMQNFLIISPSLVSQKQTNKEVIQSCWTCCRNLIPPPSFSSPGATSPPFPPRLSSEQPRD